MNKKEKNITNRMRYLIDTLNKAAKVYYQTGEELMPNFEYDKLERELEALEQETGIMLSDSPTIRTGISVDDAERLTDSRLAKVTHEYPARSLAKTKDESLVSKGIFSKGQYGRADVERRRRDDCGNLRRRKACQSCNTRQWNHWPGYYTQCQIHPRPADGASV